MRAAIADSYGGPEVMRIEDVPVPQPGPNGVLVRVHAGSVNPVDWKLRQGSLRALGALRFPVIWGCDCSGVVEQVGQSVTMFKPGDAVFGFKDGRVASTFRGTYAEYAVMPQSTLAIKPSSLTHEEAASIPLAALTAWQALVNQGRIRPGACVLIHAAAGGVGIFAVQIAKAFGAYVAATASARNHELLRSLGADVTIDYATERIADKISGYDIVLDGVGRAVWRASFRALRRGGRLVSLVAPVPPDGAGKLAFFSKVISRVAWETGRAAVSGKRLLITRAQPRGGDLEKVAALIEAGKLRTVIEAVFPLEQVAQAHRLSQAGHVRGKLVIKIV